MAPPITSDESRLPSPEELLQQLERSRHALVEAIRGMNEADLRTRPSGGAWTAAEILAHLFSTEQIFMDRARRALSQPDYQVEPTSNATQQEHIALAKRMPVPQLVHGLLAQRRTTTTFIEGLSEEHLARTLQHPVRGVQTILWQIEKVFTHEQEHAEELLTRRQAGAMAT